ncbi:MAG: tripartite tricarboxylate transporter substrate binding protein [Betaproteobacteria bacterium]
MTSRFLAAFALAWCVFVPAHAQNAPYPAKPIRLVVPFPPGGPTDVVARIIGQKLTERWGQQVLIENRAGAGGTIGAELVARAAPDGYTLVMGSTANMAVNVTLIEKLSYDPIRDFTPVNLAAITPNLLVVNPSMPAKNVREFIALAKAKPGAINYASGGSGTPSHLAAELFKTMSGVQMNHVPYKGSIPALTDIIGGQVSLMFDSMASALPFVKSGKLRALAQTGAKRASAAPDVPTIAESGLPGYEVAGWFGLYAPAGTPRDIVMKLSNEITQILNLPDVKERYALLGAEPGPGNPDEFGRFHAAEIAKWAKVIRDSGTKAE